MEVGPTAGNSVWEPVADIGLSYGEASVTFLDFDFVAVGHGRESSVEGLCRLTGTFRASRDEVQFEDLWLGAIA